MPARWWSRRAGGAQVADELSDIATQPSATQPLATSPSVSQPAPASGREPGGALLPDDQTLPDDPIIERGSFAHGVCPSCGWQGPARRARSAARKDVTKHGTGRCGSSPSYPVHWAASPVTSPVARSSGQE